MRKRLGLAKALLHQPEVLFLDEPTNGLDPEGTRMVPDYIRTLNREQGTTVFLCSHLLQQLETVCDRYVFIDDGHVIEQGSLDHLEQKYRRHILLRVETDLQLAGDTYEGVPATTRDAGYVQFTLPSTDQVPDLLSRLTQDARVYGAAIVERDLHGCRCFSCPSSSGSSYLEGLSGRFASSAWKAQAI